MAEKLLIIATVSTQPPLMCGIATYAADVCAAIQNAEHLIYALHYGDGAWTQYDGNANVSNPRELIHSPSESTNRALRLSIFNMSSAFGAATMARTCLNFWARLDSRW